MTPPQVTLLDRIERYYDEVPRASARTEEIGPFTLFVRDDPDGWPYYARPRRGGPATASVEDVDRVRSRQRALGAPETLEWVHETTPGLVATVRAAGLQVTEHPLLALGEEVRPAVVPDGVRVQLLQAGSEELAETVAAVHAGFAGNDEIERHRSPERESRLVGAGLLRMAGAFGPDGPIGGGSHSPRATVTELTGIAVLPRSRGRGVGAALTASLVHDAHSRGVETVFLSAGDERVARIYGRIGFVRVGTACIAEVPT